MMTSPITEGNNQSMHPDVRILKKTNQILKLMGKYDSHYKMLVIESQLISARAAFLEVCVREAYENRYYRDEKIKAHNLLESTIELFEQLYKEINKK